MWVQKEAWCSEGGEGGHLHARHHEDRGDHGIEVSAADGSSSVDHHWQQNLHQASMCITHVTPAAETCLPFWHCIVPYGHWVITISLLYGLLNRGEAYLIPTWLMQEQRLAQV